MLPTPFVFGKVPDRGDFVRAGRIGPLVDELDEWLQRGLLALRRPIEGNPAMSFVFGRPQGVLVGSLVPSRDRAGRSFPLVAGGATEGVQLTPGLVDSLATFIGVAASVAAEVVTGLPPETALARLTQPASPPPSEWAVRRTDTWEASTHGRLASSMGPFRLTQAPRYGLGLPLPADPAERPAGAARWLERVVAESPRRAAMTLLWTTEPERARLVVFAGSPTADALGYLLAGVSSDGVYDVDGGPSATSTAPGATT